MIQGYSRQAPSMMLKPKVYTRPGGRQGQEKARGLRREHSPSSRPTSLQTWVLALDLPLFDFSLGLHSWPVKWCRSLLKTKVVLLPKIPAKKLNQSGLGSHLQEMPLRSQRSINPHLHVTTQGDRSSTRDTSERSS